MRAAVVLALVFAIAGCAPVGPVADPNATGTPTADGVQPTGEPTVLASNLTTPWSVVRLDNGSALISERDTGLVKELTADGKVRGVGEVAGVEAFGEGGLLGLAVAPGDQATLFAFVTAASDNRVVRLPLIGEAGALSLGSAEVVIDGLPKGRNHNGGRIAFGPDGMLYITAGDAGVPDNAQSRDSLGGKILRVEPSGAVPDDNPFEGSPIWSLGHRNPQGIAWDESGQLFAAEFGQNTWDEFNRIEAGENYGWPVVEGLSDDDAFVNPVLQWSTAEASPSGLAFIDGTFFLAALRGQRVWAIYPAGDTASAVAWFEGEHGRIRHALEGPDGSLWIITSNTDGNGDQREGADELLQYELGALVEG